MEVKGIVSTHAHNFIANIVTISTDLQLRTRAYLLAFSSAKSCFFILTVILEAMYCINFSGAGRDHLSTVGRDAEPSGRFYPNLEQHVAVLDKPSPTIHIRGKDPTCVRPSRKDPRSLLAASSELATKHRYGIAFDKNDERSIRHGVRSRRFKREYETASSVFLNKSENPEVRNFQDQNSVLGMELLIEADERHEVEMAATNRTRRDVNFPPEKSTQQLTKELNKTLRLLECERSQRQTLVARLDNMDSQLRQMKKSKAKGQSPAHCTDEKTAKIAELNVVIGEQQANLDEQTTRNEKLEEEIVSVKAQNNNLNHQMRLLMFQHIPLVSSKFKDIGSVDYDVKENWAQVSNYELGEKIGEGHYGTVQRGTDLGTKQDYAVKVLNKERMKRFKDLQQITMEVHVLKHYGHPNIIRLQDVVHAPENIYLVIELCSMDLHSYHSKIGLSENSAKQVIFGILNALRHLHGNGICHLDLKPENVLLAQSADLKCLNHKDIRLCDFGLVNMVRKSDRNKGILRKGYACGTPGFFAPEMILKKQFEGRSADMWSIGAIILEITLGFTHDWIDSYNKIDSDTRLFHEGLQGCLAEIPKEKYPLHQKLLDILHSCLSIEPADRISSKEALYHPWLTTTIQGSQKEQQDYQEPPALDCCDPRPPTFPDLL